MPMFGSHWRPVMVLDSLLGIISHPGWAKGSMPRFATTGSSDHFLKNFLHSQPRKIYVLIPKGMARSPWIQQVYSPPMV